MKIFGKRRAWSIKKIKSEVNSSEEEYKESFKLKINSRSKAKL